MGESSQLRQWYAPVCLVYHQPQNHTNMNPQDMYTSYELGAISYSSFVTWMHKNGHGHLLSEFPKLEDGAEYAPSDTLVYA